MKRESNMDLLKVVATIMVVTLHVSAILVSKNINQHNIYFSLGNLFDSFTRVSVPIFVMVSGGFALSNKNNIDFKYFYKKCFFRNILPTIIWSIVYMMYIGRFKIIPFYHLWYLYMMIGMYVITPWLIRIIINISKRKILMLGVMFLLLGMIISIFGDLHWSIRFIQYAGYYVLGYAIKNINFRKIDKKIYIAIYMLSSSIVFIITEIMIRSNVIIKDKLFFYGYVTPFVIIASIALYCTFLSNSKIQFNITKIINNSFNIYVVHAAVLDILNRLIYSKGINTNSVIYIPVMIVCVFLISYILSIIIGKVVNVFNYTILNRKELR